jgi:Tol biopolymer transport system component
MKRATALVLVMVAACSRGGPSSKALEEPGRPEAATLEVGGGPRQRWDCVAFLTDDGIYVVNLDGTGRTYVSAEGRWPALSPDGTKIAYEYFWGVYVMNADGTDKRRLSPPKEVLKEKGAEEDSYPVFAPDGERVAVERHYQSNIDIIFLPTSGGPEENFSTKIENAWERERRDNNGSSLPPRDITLPVFSGDARTVAFSDYTDISGSRLWIANADGSGVRLLAKGDVHSPALSPDGKKLAFHEGPKGGRDICVINADGTGRRQLTKGDRDSSSPAFSPDGKEIIYESSTRDEEDPVAWLTPDIYIMNADGSEPRELIGRPEGAWSSRFTPDCSKIVFCRYMPWHGDDVGQGIYVFTLWNSGNASGFFQRFLGAGYIFSLGPSLVEGRLLDSYGNWHDVIEEPGKTAPGE